MTTTTIEDLCRTIDAAGDDAILPILADALEAAGAGRRLPEGKHPCQFSDRDNLWCWCRSGSIGWGYELPHRLFRRLRGGVPMCGDTRGYPTRSAAYLALSAALV